jgi:hypothetical protein
MKPEVLINKAAPVTATNNGAIGNKSNLDSYPLD